MNGKELSFYTGISKILSESFGSYFERFIEKVNGYNEVFQEFTEESWLGLADKIIVKDKKHFVVVFKNGVEIPVEA